MDWLGLLAITVPYAIIVSLIGANIVKRFKKVPKKGNKPNLRLIKGGKYYE